MTNSLLAGIVTKAPEPVRPRDTRAIITTAVACTLWGSVATLVALSLLGQLR